MHQRQPKVFSSKSLTPHPPTPLRQFSSRKPFLHRKNCPPISQRHFSSRKLFLQRKNCPTLFSSSFSTKRRYRSRRFSYLDAEIGNLMLIIIAVSVQTPSPRKLDCAVGDIFRHCCVIFLYVPTISKIKQMTNVTRTVCR